MASNLENKINKLKQFSFEREAREIVEQNRELIADLQATQLFSGLNEKGEKIYPEYAPFTIQEKIKKGQVYSRVTYNDTGELYKSLFTLVSGKKFSIKSESFKFAKMIKRSGVRTIGLNLESRREFIESVTRPEMRRRYKEKVSNG